MLAFATRAPGVDNTQQPRLWRSSDSGLELFADRIAVP